MKVDLHTHTFPASSCSAISHDEYVGRCVELGLGAIALTNHGAVADNLALEAPLARAGIVLVHGVEISTIFGDFVVFTPDLEYLATLRDVQDPPTPESIPPSAAVVWVHPAVGGGRSGAAYYPTLERVVAPLVDAVEIFNGNWPERRNVQTAERIAGELRAARTGGSDAHRAADIMTCYTEIPGAVRSTADVVSALKGGTTSPGRDRTGRLGFLTRRMR